MSGYCYGSKLTISCYFYKTPINNLMNHFLQKLNNLLQKITNYRLVYRSNKVTTGTGDDYDRTKHPNYWYTELAKAA